MDQPSEASLTGPGSCSTLQGGGMSPRGLCPLEISSQDWHHLFPWPGFRAQDPSVGTGEAPPTVTSCPLTTCLLSAPSTLGSAALEVLALDRSVPTRRQTLPLNWEPSWPPLPLGAPHASQSARKGGKCTGWSD